MTHVVAAQDIVRWQNLSDEELVRRVVQGQAGLFELLMRRYNERIYRAARGIVRDDSEAEDVMQQAYVNAYAHLRQFDGRAAFATWLTRIALHEAYARLRRRRRAAYFDDQPGSTTTLHGPSSFDPERLAFTGELKALLEAAIDQLPDGQREVFMLRDVEGLSTAETAECLDVSHDTVKTRLSRARASLRRSLFENAGLSAATAFPFLRPRCDRMVAAVMQRIG